MLLLVNAPITYARVDRSILPRCEGSFFRSQRARPMPPESAHVLCVLVYNVNGVLKMSGDVVNGDGGVWGDGGAWKLCTLT